MSTDLRHALSLVADATTTPTDPMDDLARARSAAHARRRRRLGLALSGLTASLVVAVVGAVALDTDSTSTTRPGGPPSAAVVEPVVLVAGPVEAAPYVFDRVPEGWTVQGQSPFAVTIAPEGGSVSDDPNDFRGKLVILFDRNRLGGGQVEAYDGREFRVHGDSGYTTVSVVTRDDEPFGVVRVQYPDDAGWALPQMLEFLDGVRVTSSAEPGLG